MKINKGVILAGGKGTRLLPATRTQNKHLLSILNVPMILYPINTLKQLGIRDILIVSGGDHIGGFAEFLGDGGALGCSLTYKVQPDALGIANALALSETFMRDEELFAAILGDNFFGLDQQHWDDYTNRIERPTIFTSLVEDASRFGVFVASEHRIVEKPKGIGTGLAVTGLYVYDQKVFRIVEGLSKSDRGEYEITDVNNAYHANAELDIMHIADFWSDMGTRESMYKTIEYVVKSGYSIDLPK